ncbi:hypothetical protein CRES_1623 [Corynebacterium resistens DSM 45100]|uniref:Uncharacterized protein n=1 Tax=Corynebacterium resistens (strain DSM 45100 / JCM 12819 / GTC 2026 / SICGH 158) TaxID=662755 RepID=F8E0I6_CORRG|nr:hypothetical protein CRES_1623 [Corynebacterium resistens DSM 45100]
MRSRAPYLFEQVERDVPRTEQDRLWAEGKRKERAAKLERLGEPYRTFLKEKDAPAQATPKAQATQAVPNAQTPRAAQPAPTAQPAEPAEPAQPAKPMNGAQPAQSMQAESTVQQAQSARSFVGTQRDAERPQVTSALVEAENVIRRARQLGLPDSKIPTDIRFPMVGLELDEPGESDRRLLDAVRAFHQQMDDKGAN